MAEIQILMEMGFPKEQAERALQVTNHKGVEPAMEWLLAHADECISSSLVVQKDNLNLSGAGTSSEDPVSSALIATSTETPDTEEADSAEAKSLKCDECGRLFKNQMEVEFHAAKSGHSSFSESTEEKKPLTEEERKQQLALLETKIKQKRLEREEKEKKEAADREKHRIKSGKDMLEAKARMEELEMKKILDQRKREKAEEKAARDRVKAQIESDKAARKMKMTGQTGDSTTVPVPAPVVLQSLSTIGKAKDYINTRIQIRLQDGSTLTETFDVKEQLSAVRLFIRIKLGNDIPFGLMTSFPRKVFTDDDYDTSLEVLGLVPSAVIILTKIP